MHNVQVEILLVLESDDEMEVPSSEHNAGILRLQKKHNVPVPRRARERDCKLLHKSHL